MTVIETGYGKLRKRQEREEILHKKQQIDNLENQLEQQNRRLDRAEKTITALNRMLKETEARTIDLERGFEAAIRAVEVRRTDGEWYADTD